MSNLLDVCRTPARSAAEMMDQVEHVRAQDPKILAAAATIFLAASTQFEHLADRAVGDQLTLV